MRGPVPIMKGGLGFLNPCDPFVSFTAHPLAKGFSLVDGRVSVTVPEDADPGSDYALVRTYPLLRFDGFHPLAHLPVFLIQ